MNDQKADECFAAIDAAFAPLLVTRAPNSPVDQMIRKVEGVIRDLGSTSTHCSDHGKHTMAAELEGYVVRLKKALDIVNEAYDENGDLMPAAEAELG